jgi:hypothetical protein
VIAPVVVLNDKPAGSAGAMLKLTGVVPPPPVTGVNEVGSWFSVNTFDATAGVAVTGGFTASEKFADAVSPFASVTVTV